MAFYIWLAAPSFVLRESYFGCLILTFVCVRALYQHYDDSFVWPCFSIRINKLL